MPPELREELLKLAVGTDVVSEHRGIDPWRTSAVTAARWLLRVAALAPEIPQQMQRSIRSIADLARKMNAAQKGSGEYAIDIDELDDDGEEEEEEA